MIIDSHEEWNSIHHEDLWVYNKLFLSQSILRPRVTRLAKNIEVREKNDI